MLCISLFLKRVIRGSKWTPACTGEEGLLRLLKKAHGLYLEEVVTQRKSYLRFALDFTNSTCYHDNTDAWSKNEHQKNHCIISGLLLNYEKMVRRFFDCESLEEPKYSELLNEFYSCDLPHSPTSGGIVTDMSCQESAEPNSNNNLLIDKETISLIVQLANEVNLFKEVLNAESVSHDYEKNELKPITSSNNTRLVLVLDRLAANNIIPYNWQTQIERKHLVLSSTGKKYLNRHDLSSVLNRIKEMPLSSEHTAVISVVDRFIKSIKDREIK